MLKIKDNVDLKKLEKFGFKPKYDEDTGEIYEYYRDFIAEEPRLIDRTYKETIKFYVIKKKRIFRTECECCGGTWDLFNQYFGYEYIDLIYDLIQAGLVEKVK